MTFTKRQIRTRVKVRGTTERPRLSVYKSNKFMSAQIIDDVKAVTIVSVNEKALGKLGELGKDGIGKAKEIGKMIGIFLFAGILAFACNASNLLNTARNDIWINGSNIGSLQIDRKKHIYPTVSHAFCFCAVFDRQ